MCPFPRSPLPACRLLASSNACPFSSLPCCAQALGYQPELLYNIALCYYKTKQFGPALKHLAEIIEKAVREHPELSVGRWAGGREGPQLAHPGAGLAARTAIVRRVWALCTWHDAGKLGWAGGHLRTGRLARGLAASSRPTSRSPIPRRCLRNILPEALTATQITTIGSNTYY